VDGENTNQMQGDGEMRDLGFVIRVAGLGVAAGLALQPAHAGDRKQASVRHGEISSQRVVFATQARSTGDSYGGRIIKAQGRGEFSFAPVSPLTSAVRGQRSEVGSQKGSAAQGERKNVTFFRLDPKFGDVSVQPVMGGVNGAQLSVGY
jgi:hypothetical protein